jgi:hypothetical protein
MTLLILEVRLPDDLTSATAPIFCRASPASADVAIMLMLSALPAIVLSLVNSGLALWAFALNFARCR